MRLWKRYRRWISAVLVLVLPLIVYRAHARAPHLANPFEHVVRTLTTPIQSGLTQSVGWISDVWARYVDLADARRELSSLRIQYGQLRRRLDELELVASENQALRGLLSLDQRSPESEFVMARVVGAGLGAGGETVIIDRGSLHDLRAGLPVVSEEGLVGSLSKVSWTSSEVILISDERTAVLVESVQTGARGRLRGNGLRVRIEDVLRADGLHAGERWVTSGLGGVFPAGIPVGSVLEVRTTPDRPMLEADIEPAAGLRRLRVVAVVKVPQRAEPLYTPDSQLPPRLWSTEEP
ncbi:MAG: rod shape-determining protein MreC [Myxococcota bacterium]